MILKGAGFVFLEGLTFFFHATKHGCQYIVLWHVNFLGYGGSGWRYGFSFLFLIVGSYCFLSLPVSDLHCMVDVGILCTLMFVSYLWNLLSFLLEWSGLMTALEWCRLLFLSFSFSFPFLFFFR
jgi:hypothetical protein